jgi:hypothetical protein
MLGFLETIERLCRPIQGSSGWTQLRCRRGRSPMPQRELAPDRLPDALGRKGYSRASGIMQGKEGKLAS